MKQEATDDALSLIQAFQNLDQLQQSPVVTCKELLIGSEIRALDQNSFSAMQDQ